MPQTELLTLFEKVLNTLSPDTFDDAVEQLRFIFPETLLLAALDLVDRDSVIKYTTSWGRCQYEVLGSTATYAVFPTLPSCNPNSLAYCSCPAFAYSVLRADTHLMCKHVLAILIAEKLSRCVERGISRDEWAAIVARQYS